ncbi:MAG: NAD(P)H-hydrate dehydratase [candidate division NC10 bacterium]|nr:NAD(P)H-hydrate dehydratase [candidate division NC10 bacterium]
MKVVTAAEMQEMDRKATSEFGIPSLLLMENAGLQVALEIERSFPQCLHRPVVLFCGKGNNGGDGFVIARHLLNWGRSVHVLLWGRKQEVKGDALINLQILEKMGASLREVQKISDLEADLSLIERSGLLVDALLGTGAMPPAKGLLGEAISFLNGSGKPIVAVDLPSGLGADESHPAGPCVQATLTVTLGLPKRSLILYPAAGFAGKLKVADIGMPRALLENPEIKLSLIEAKEVGAAFPPRKPDAHKGNFGHVLVIAGSPGKTGAGAMASKAALRIGAGLVTFALPGSLNDAMEAKLDEVMTEPLPETEERTLSCSALEKILQLLEGKDCLALGPGLSSHPETGELVRKLIPQVKIPMVVDADGINALSLHLQVLGEVRGPLILTPHPGELSRLLSVSVEEVQRNRVAIAQKFSSGFRLFLVLKGKGTLISDPGGEVFINPSGGPGMATAGSGDVLTGLLAGLIASGTNLPLSLKAGVFLHGLAGDLAAEEWGEEAMVAGDILSKIPDALRQIKKVG